MTKHLDGDAQRTLLAAERTWLAWWRTAIAVTAVAVAVGGVIPRLVGGSRTPYVILGMGYAALSVSIFVGAARRQKAVKQALQHGKPVEVDVRWVTRLSAAGVLLAMATLIVIAVEA